jgi:hypothetical protein
MGIDPRSAKVTFRAFAKCKFIDPEAYQRNIVYIPQMKDYADEWTSRKQSRNYRATPESLPSNSLQSQRSESESESEPEPDTEAEVDDKSKSDNPPPDQKLTSNSFSSSEKPDVTQKRDLTSPASTPPAWLSQYDPWIYLGIDRGRVPKRFRMDSDDDSNAPNFETRFKMWWQKYRLNCKEMGEEPIPEEFAEHVLENCEDEEVEYPPILLKRKKELSAA